MLERIAHRVEARGPIPESAAFDDTGIHLTWASGSHEARYVGSMIPWTDVRDADPTEAPPEVRLLDGRTCFISAMQKDELLKALVERKVALRRRPPIWPSLLEVFLDGGSWGSAEVLRSAGIGVIEEQAVHARLRFRMWAMTALTWEWAHYGQADAIEAVSLLRVRRLSWLRYRKFREWADSLADRGGHGSELDPPSLR